MINNSMCSFQRLKKKTSLCFFFCCLLTLLPVSVQAAGGLSIQGTRIIYPLDSKLVSLSLKNSSDTDSFLVQSWVEDASGKKSDAFVVTPPLYLSGPRNENIVRIMYVSSPLPTDREILFWFVAKSIPSIDKSKLQGRNMLLLTLASRIKLFVRPARLTSDRNAAPSALLFHQAGNQIEISNPTPYYLTLAEIQFNGKKREGVMVSPLGHSVLPFSGKKGTTITFRTIDDFGSLSPRLNAIVQ